MIQLYINEQIVDVNEAMAIELIKQISDIQSPGDVKTDVSRTIKLPMSKNNQIIFDYINRLDRTTNLINPSKKYNYVLIFNGNLISRGYVKITEINNEYITINLFSEEAEFYKKLTDKKVIDLKIEELNGLQHILNREFVYKNFYNENGEIDNWIRYVPMFNGTYENYDSKRIQVDAYQEGNETLTEKDLGYDHDEYSVSNFKNYVELRASQQKPSIYINKLIESIIKENGYNLKGDFCVPINPYYMDTLLMTQKYNTQLVDATEGSYSTFSKTDSSEIFLAGQSGVRYEAITPIDDKLNLLSGNYLDLSSLGDMIFDLTASFKVKVNWKGMDRPDINRIYFNRINDDLSLELGVTPDVASFEGNPFINIDLKKFFGWKDNDSNYYLVDENYNKTFNITIKNVKAKSYGTIIQMLPLYINCSLKNNMLVQLRRVDGAYIYGGDYPIQNIIVDFNSCNLSIKKVSGRIIDNNIDISKLFPAELTQKDIISEYCKLFGLQLTVKDKDVYIQTKNEYYGERNIIDLTNKINLDKDVVITPLNFNKKYLEYGYRDDTSTSFLSFFKNKYGKTYGSKVVNTGYEFDESRENVYSKSIFYPIVPSTQLIGGQKLTLLSSYDLDNNVRKGKKTKLHFILDCKENISIITPIKITDETPKMFGEGKFFWNGTSTNTLSVKKSGNSYLIPKFHIINNNYTVSLDWAKPNETLYEVNDSIYPESSTIFDKFHKAYVSDRYNANTKKLKASFKLNAIDKFKIKLNDFIYLYNKYWTINSMNYDVLSDADTIIELISVENINNYADGQESYKPKLIVTTPMPIVFEAENNTLIEVDINSNLEWEILETSSWCSGAYLDNTKLYVVCYDNTSDYSREGYIRIGLGNIYTDVIVHQKGNSETSEHQLTLTPSTFNFTWSDTSDKYIVVNSNKSGRIVGYPSWVKLETMEFGGNLTIRFNSTTNSSTSSRSGSIVFATSSDSQGSITKFVTVTQGGKPSYIPSKLK